MVFVFNSRNLQLKKIKRTEKKGTESVMDEKFSVLFWTEFLVGELKFQVQCYLIIIENNYIYANEEMM